MKLKLIYLLAMLVILPGVALADFFGIGEAAAGIAEASWKIIAINAIVSAKMIVVLLVVVVGLIVIAGRFLTMAERFGQDNKFTPWERGIIVASGGVFLLVAALLLPLGFKLITVIF